MLQSNLLLLVYAYLMLSSILFHVFSFSFGFIFHYYVTANNVFSG